MDIIKVKRGKSRKEEKRIERKGQKMQASVGLGRVVLLCQLPFWVPHVSTVQHSSKESKGSQTFPKNLQPPTPSKHS